MAHKHIVIKGLLYAVTRVSGHGSLTPLFHTNAAVTF